MRKKILVIFLLTIFTSLFLINTLSSQTFEIEDYPYREPYSENGLEEIKSTTLRILGNIINFLFSSLMIIGSGLFIFLGIRYILGWGDVKDLHESLRYLILGIILLILSLFIPNLIKSFIEQSI